MNILYYTWFENSADDLYEGLLLFGYTVCKMAIPLKDYSKDDDFAHTLQHELLLHSYDAIITFDFFPIISDIAEKLNLPYISWIYDSPHYTLFSPAIRNKCNYIFIFDRLQYQELKDMDLLHVFHLPLAVNTARLKRQFDQSKNPAAEHRFSLSFVGSLYENNLYRQICYLPDYLKGYIDGLINAQKVIYGSNFIYELITDDITKQLGDYISFNLDPGYHFKKSTIFANIINTELTHRERIHLLSELGRHYPLTLFTASDKRLISTATFGGTVGYLQEMPNIFYSSDININLTLRSIVSGIPLRALDIMGAGGFLLSNYQPELASYFVDGSELVLFDSEEDLLLKTSYYLTHENERKEIAQNGLHKIQQEFTYQVQLEKIFRSVFKTAFYDR
ncbi:DUF3880 domain-containing protein [Lachnospiraceae bacterium ZAX-1]